MPAKASAAAAAEAPFSGDFGVSRNVSPSTMTTTAIPKSAANFINPALPPLRCSLAVIFFGKWFARVFERCQFADDCIIFGQFARFCDAKVRQSFYRRPVEVLARVFRISRALEKPAREKTAQCRGGIHAADVVDPRTGRRPHVEHDSQDLKTGVSDLPRQLLLEGGFHHFARVLRNGDTRLGLALYEREAAPLEPLTKSIESRLQLSSGAFEKRRELFAAHGASLYEEERLRLGREVGKTRFMRVHIWVCLRP